MKKCINIVNKATLQDLSFSNTLKKASNKEMISYAELIRKEIISQTSINGGHLSSNLGAVELTLALHKYYNFPKDKLIFDVGHQCYAHKILSGRSLDNLRKINGVSGFQKIEESLYDCYEAGHSSTSISAAGAFAYARKMHNEDYNIIAFTGDGSIVNGLSFEGLNNLSQIDSKIIIILNDNDMSISKPVGSLSKTFAKISTAAGYNKIKAKYKSGLLKTNFGEKILKSTSDIKNRIKYKLVPSTFFDNLGLQYIGPIDGHNFKQIEKALKRAENTSKSVIIHACTIKGKGYELAEQDKKGDWHGVSPFKIENGEKKSKNKDIISWSKIFSQLIEKKMDEDNKAVTISPGTINGSELNEVFEKFPERCIDVGIAEEHAVTLAGALNLNKINPIICIYSTFLQRSYDQICHDVARLGVSSTFIVDRCGFVGNDGDTHQGVYDESFLSSIPNVVVTMPSDINDAMHLFNESFKQHGPFFIRIPRSFECITELKCNEIYEYGKWNIMQSSKSHKKVLFTCGPLGKKLCELLKEKDIEIVNVLYIMPLNKDNIAPFLSYENIYIYWPYSTEQGFVNAFKAFLIDNHFKGKVKSFCIPNIFITHMSINEQLEKYDLLPSQVYTKIN